MRFAAQAWLYALVLVPLLWLLLSHGDGRARRALRALLGERAEAHVEGAYPRLRRQRRLLLLAGVAALVVALARPQWGARELTVRERGTDVVIALDVSNSMLAEDVPPSRLVQARAALDGFLARLDRGRVGLVLFAGAAYVQCPLTLDYATARLFLGQASPDMITAQGTGIAAALATARGLLERGGAAGSTARRAIVLVSDGEDFGGGWAEEAVRCRDAGLVILAVPVGLSRGGLIPARDDRGRAAGYLKDDAGQVVLSRADPAALEQLARATNGAVVPSGPAGPDLASLRGEIARLGERDLEERRISAYEERFMWPLVVALILLSLRELLFPRRRGDEAADGLRGPDGADGFADSSRSRRRGGGVGAAAVVGLLLLMGAGIGAPLAAPQTPSLRPPGAAEADRGRELYGAARYEEALRAFTAARALSPNDPRLTLAVGEALARLGRGKEAVEEFRRAAAQSTRTELRAESLYNAGTALLATGEAQEAAKALRESLSLDPGRDDALRNLEIAVREQARQQQSDQKQQQSEQSPQQQPPQQQQQQQQQQKQDQQSQEQSQPSPEKELNREGKALPGQMTRDQAYDLLRVLDRDEEELRRSVQKRLKGEPAPGGKRW